MTCLGSRAPQPGAFSTRP